jgi:hypothetical protein
MNVRLIVRRFGVMLLSFVSLWLAYAIGYHHGITSPRTLISQGEDRYGPDFNS